MKKSVTKRLKYLSIKFLIFSPKKYTKLASRKNLADRPIADANIRYKRFVWNTPAVTVNTL
jgi:hypothetical protein